MRNSGINKISLILPCYNEEANLQKGVLDKIENFVGIDPRFLEVLIVDDGSGDKSKQIIKEKYLPRFPKFKLIENRHMGKAFAVITGIEQAKGDVVIFSDVDLATPIEEAEKLIRQADDGFPIVIGSRKSQREGAPLSRKIMALGGIVIRRLVIGLRGIHDSQCGFKLFDKKIAKEIIKQLQVYNNHQIVYGPSVSAGFDIEFLFVAQKLGFKIKEIPVTWKHVETRRVNFFKDSWQALKDILKIRYFALQGKYDKKE